MQTRPTHLLLPFTAFAALLGIACATDPTPDDAARLAVVFTADDGDTQTIGSYDAGTGELAFVPQAQVDLREHVADPGYSARVDIAGDLAEIDLEAGVVVTLDWLEVGEVLELEVVRPGSGTLVIGEMVLVDGEDAPRWKVGNKVWNDDWLSPN